MSQAAEFLIKIDQQVRGDAASILDKTKNALDRSIASFKELDVAAQKTGAAVNAAQSKLSEGQSKLSKLMAAGDTKGFWKQAGAVDKLRDTESKARAEHEKATAALNAGKGAVEDNAKRLKQVTDATKGSGDAAGEAAGETKGMGRAFDRLGGPLGSSLGSVFKLKEAFGKLGGGMGAAVGGAVLFVAIAAAIVVGLVAATAAILKYGIANADAARDQGLLLEGMTGSAKAGDALGDTFTDLERNFGASSDRLLQLTDQLQNSGIKGDNLKTALTAISESEAAVGTGGTDKLIQSLTSGSKSAQQLANDVDKKLGGVAKQRMLGLGNQAKVLETNLAETFGGLKIDGLLEGLSKLVGLLDSNTASGKAIKLVFEKIFQPLVDAAANALPYVEIGVLEFINTLLRVYIAAKPATKAISSLFGITPNRGIEIALGAGKFAAEAFVVAIGAVIAVLAATALALDASTAGFAALAALNAPITNFGVSLRESFDKARAALSGIDWGAVGEAIISGIISGIEADAGKLVDAVKGIGDSAKDALKNSLGIHSPSTVFAELGGHTAAGFAMGIDDGASGVSAAVNDMVKVPERAPTPTSTGGSREGVKVYVNIDASGGGDTMDRLKIGVTRLFEELALQIGTDVSVEVTG